MNLQSRKSAVITGASAGIGRATAIEFTKRGFEVLICARRIEPLQQLADEIAKSGGVVHVHECDVASVESVRALAVYADTLWDHVDVLFNNAGSGSAIALQDTSDEAFDGMIDSCIKGTFFCCREFLRLLSAAPSAVIINNASIAARRGFPNFSAYSAAKGGVAAFSQSLREELRPRNIRVTTLFAGATDTPYWDTVPGEWDRSAMMSSETVAQIVVNAATLPPSAQMEEIQVMPAGGAL